MSSRIEMMMAGAGGGQKGSGKEEEARFDEHTLGRL